MKPSNYIEKGWCQRAIAKDKYGFVCNPTAPGAVVWCLSGAIHAAYPERLDKWEEVTTNLGINYIGSWNDDPTRTKQEVLNVLRAIGE